MSVCEDVDLSSPAVLTSSIENLFAFKLDFATVVQDMCLIACKQNLLALNSGLRLSPLALCGSYSLPLRSLILLHRQFPPEIRLRCWASSPLVGICFQLSVLHCKRYPHRPKDCISMHSFCEECFAQNCELPFVLDAVPGAHFPLRPIQKLYMLTAALSHGILCPRKVAW